MKIPLSFLLLLLSIFGSAQNSNKAEIERYFDRIDAKGQGMGSFAIVKNGKVVYARAFGYASIEDGKRATSETKYRIGSISKTFTATIILQMVNEGKLALQTPLSQFFPGFPKADKITVELLLRHRSGIHNFGNDRSEKYKDTNPQTREEVIEIFKNAEMDFEPGAKADYNNANYVILSLLAEEVDKLTFSEILQKRVAEPLQLKYTYYGDSINPAKNEAHSYYGKRKWHRNSEGDMKTLAGAGAIVSTPSDVAIFFHALLNHHFFPDSILTQMETLEDGIGLGLYRYPFGSQAIFGHAGNIDAFSAMAGCFADSEVSFALCLNGERMELNKVLVGALRTWFE